MVEVTRTYKFEVGLYALQYNACVASGRAELVPKLLMCNIVDVAVRVYPVDARGFGVAVIYRVVDVTCQVRQ